MQCTAENALFSGELVIQNRESTCRLLERLPFVRKIRWKIKVKWYFYFFFWAPKTGTELSCTIYKIQVNVSHSLDMNPGTGNPNKWYRKFRSFRYKREKKYFERYYFFPENFHRDELFPLNSPQNFRVFRTNSERFLFVSPVLISSVTNRRVYWFATYTDTCRICPLEVFYCF